MHIFTEQTFIDMYVDIHWYFAL